MSKCDRWDLLSDEEFFVAVREFVLRNPRIEGIKWSEYKELLGMSKRVEKRIYREKKLGSTLGSSGSLRSLMLFRNDLRNLMLCFLLHWRRFGSKDSDLSYSDILELDRVRKLEDLEGDE